MSFSNTLEVLCTWILCMRLAKDVGASFEFFAMYFVVCLQSDVSGHSRRDRKFLCCTEFVGI